MTERDLRRMQNPMKNIVIIRYARSRQILGVILCKPWTEFYRYRHRGTGDYGKAPARKLLMMRGPMLSWKPRKKRAACRFTLTMPLLPREEVWCSVRRQWEHLRKDGVVIYLKISFEEMVRRLNNITTRGIVLVAGQSLRPRTTRGSRCMKSMPI